jgi:hypothetical protein
MFASQAPWCAERNMLCCHALERHVAGRLGDLEARLGHLDLLSRRLDVAAGRPPGRRASALAVRRARASGAFVPIFDVFRQPSSAHPWLHGGLVDPLILLVSDPPHGTVDHQAVAEILGLDDRDAVPKLDFAAPEIFVAWEAARATEMARDLRAAGVRLATIEGIELTKIPWPSLVSSFEFASDRLVTRLDAEEVTVPYDRPVLAVFCAPPDGFPASGPLGDEPRGTPDGPDGLGLMIAEAIQWMSVLDLYVEWDDGLERITIARDAADFAGLGPVATKQSGSQNMRTLLDRCRKSFTGLRIDDRLAGVRPRQRFVMGDTSFNLDLRKRFSFGTLLLQQALESISPSLRDLPQWELASRLAVLLAARKG